MPAKHNESTDNQDMKPAFAGYNTFNEKSDNCKL